MTMMARQFLTNGCSINKHAPPLEQSYVKRCSSKPRKYQWNFNTVLLFVERRVCDYVNKSVRFVSFRTKLVYKLFLLYLLTSSNRVKIDGIVMDLTFFCFYFMDKFWKNCSDIIMACSPFEISCHVIDRREVVRK